MIGAQGSMIFLEVRTFTLQGRNVDTMRTSTTYVLLEFSGRHRWFPVAILVSWAQVALHRLRLKVLDGSNRDN